VNRVFLLLDFMAVAYISWWVLDDWGVTWSRVRQRAVIAVCLVAAIARGYYVVAIEADRQLVQMTLPHTAWVEAMGWLRTQPSTWHVLAHPDHSLTVGPSVRVAAERDTFLDAGKDPAMALYDRRVAMRIAERRAAVTGFDQLTTDGVRSLATRYDLDVMVDTIDRTFDFPVLYRNDRFVIYDLR
jgi:hypothetical protein